MSYNREQLEEAFNALDTNKDGSLEFNELKEVLKKRFQYSDSDAHKICLVSYLLFYSSLGHLNKTSCTSRKSI